VLLVPRRCVEIVLYNTHRSKVVAWLSGSALVSINEVTLRRARLVLGWVTVFGRVRHLGVEPATEVDSAFHLPRDGKMSISFRAE